MKLLFIVDRAVGGSGPHRNVVGSLNALTARDDVNVVLLTKEIDADEPFARSSNLHVHLGFDPHDPRKAFSNMLKVASAAKGCDVVYVPSGLKAMLYAQAARWRKPLVVGPNVTPLPLPSRRHDSPGPFELNLLSDVWFENSRNRQSHVMIQTGRTDIQFIHHAIDTARFSPENQDQNWKNDLGIPTDTATLLYVGRDNTKRKGVSQLINAFLLCQEQVRCHLVLIGRMSDSTIAQTRGMQNVSILGFQSGVELSKAYASSDIFIMPSSWESFGFTTLEAMASGCAVLASNAGAIPEVVKDQETGLLVDIVGPDGHHAADAPNILAAGLTKLIENQDMRQQFGRNGRKRALTHFSEERLGNDLMRIFGNAINA